MRPGRNNATSSPSPPMSTSSDGHLQVQHNGQCTSLPYWGREFDSPHLLYQLRRGRLTDRFYHYQRNYILDLIFSYSIFKQVWLYLISVQNDLRKLNTLESMITGSTSRRKQVRLLPSLHIQKLLFIPQILTDFQGTVPS